MADHLAPDPADYEDIGAAADDWDAGDIKLTPDGHQALAEAAHGDTRRMNMLLTTASFLAETEHAPAIDGDLMRRAAELQPRTTTIQAADSGRWLGSRRPRRTGLLPMLAGMAVLAACVVLLLVTRHGGPAQPMPMPAASHVEGVASASAPRETVPVPMTTLVKGAAPVAAQAAPASAAAAKAAAAALPPEDTLLPALPPAVAVVAAPGMVAPPIARRTANPHVIVKFFMRSPGSPPRARFIQQRLLASWFVVHMIPDVGDAPPRAAAVLYFHREDAAAAAQVKEAATLLTAPPILVGNGRLRWPPRGTIELILP
jgi:hypothetical protein